MVFRIGTKYPNDSLNLDSLDKSNISKLELLAICGSLDKKELVRVNAYDDNLVSLTEKGRTYVLRRLKEDQT